MRRVGLALILALWASSALAVGPYYVRSTDGNDADDGTTWALAKATVAGALAVAAAGDTIYVSQSHAETQASAMTWTSPGTAAAPVKILCVNDGAEPPTALATTATVTTTGVSSITISGFAYLYGISLSVAAGSTGGAAFNAGAASASAWVYLADCKITIGTTSSGGAVVSGASASSSDDSLLVLDNTTLKFGATTQGVAPTRSFLWINTPSAIDATGSVPAGLFKEATGSAGRVEVSGVDLSALGSGKSLVAPISTGSTLEYYFRNCKLGASVAVKSSQAIVGQGGPNIYVDNCASDTTNWSLAHYKYAGAIVAGSTIKRTGGASDGTTGISWNMTSLAGASFVSPLASPSIYVWNETTGSAKTLTVEILHDSLTDLTESEVWAEVEYLGSSLTPQASYATDHNSTVLTLSSTAQSAGTGTGNWTTTGLTNPRSQKVTVTVTPQMKGLFRVVVYLGKASYTIYVDPKVTVS